MFYIRTASEKQIKGPFTINQIRSLWNNGTITALDCYCPGRIPEAGDDWTPLNEMIDEIERPPQNATVSASLKTSANSPKSRGMFIIAALFGGLLGAHNFYAGYLHRGLGQLLLLLGGVLVGHELFFLAIGIGGLWAIGDIAFVTKDADGIAMIG